MTHFEHRIPYRPPDGLVERDYIGTVWIGDKPGFDVHVRAKSIDDAWYSLKMKYGEDCILSVWNEEDAQRPR